jgi:signal transduction histidine kinase
LIDSNFLDKPLEDVDYLQKKFSLKSDHKLISWLIVLDNEINSLRKTGESILTVSKELDKAARENVDNFISIASISIIVFLPLFIIVGFWTILFITGNIVKRLRLLTDIVEKTGKGSFLPMPVSERIWAGADEVETLIQKFNTMEEQLVQREKELLQSKKLAAIGTLASGVAHELNNPLNNIYTTAQRLMKKSGDESEFIRKGLDDIFGQTMRVKSIVGDLLEFARGREPHLMPVELHGMIAGVYKNLSASLDAGRIRFTLKTYPEEIVIYADPEQIERVFLNLFSNAIDAIAEAGELIISAEEQYHSVRIVVSDTGRGMPKEMTEKIFEPFFTTKDKGTGLGLAIVFNIIQKHNGEIQVESEECRGTTFIITLPKSAGKHD